MYVFYFLPALSAKVVNKNLVIFGGPTLQWPRYPEQLNAASNVSLNEMALPII
jgi:hypothetical protein